MPPSFGKFYPWAMNNIRAAKISKSIALSDFQKDLLAAAMRDASEPTRQAEAPRFAEATPAAKSVSAEAEQRTTFIL